MLHAKRRFVSTLPDDAKVLDVGCWNYSFYRYCEAVGDNRFHHYGVDSEDIGCEGRPPDYAFVKCNVDDSPLPFPDEQFDAVVASHVIEHLSRPMKLLDEIFRVLKVGGVLYLECPSDRSLRLPSMPFKYELFKSLNFYDDPTHTGRPHTPQSLYRLFRMYGAEVIESKYLTSNRVRLLFPIHLIKALVRRDAEALEFAVWWAVGFSVYGIARKAGNGDRQYVLG
jgi:SAM-dependent methyltransferase